MSGERSTSVWTARVVGQWVLPSHVSSATQGVPPCTPSLNSWQIGFPLQDRTRTLNQKSAHKIEGTLCAVGCADHRSSGERALSRTEQMEGSSFSRRRNWGVAHLERGSHWAREAICTYLGGRQRPSESKSWVGCGLSCPLLLVLWLARR